MEAWLNLQIIVGVAVVAVILTKQSKNNQDKWAIHKMK